MKTITEFEQQLTEACATTEHNGRQIVPDDYRTRVRGDTCCPLGAMHDFYNYPCADSMIEATGLEHNKLAAFINGFGGDSEDNNYGEPMFFLSGPEVSNCCFEETWCMMLDFIRAVQAAFVTQLGFEPRNDANLIPKHVPDGVYVVKVNGATETIHVRDGKLNFH